MSLLIARIGAGTLGRTSWYRQLSFNDSIKNKLYPVKSSFARFSYKLNRSPGGLDFIKSLMNRTRSRLNTTRAERRLDPFGITKLGNSRDFFSAQRNLESVFDKIAAQRKGGRGLLHRFNSRNRFLNPRISGFNSRNSTLRQSNPYDLVRDLKSRASSRGYSPFSSSRHNYSNATVYLRPVLYG